MGRYTTDTTIVDNGNPQCEQRKHFDAYIKSFWEKGCVIATNIRTYEILINEKADNLFRISPCFFNAAIYNTFALSTIWLTSFFSKSDSASLWKFLDYCERNQKHIFTMDCYVETVNVPNSKVKVDMGDFATRLQEAKQLMNDNADLINRIKVNRNKAFAHFDESVLVTGKRQLTFSLKDLKDLFNLAENVVNKMKCFYDRKTLSFEPINVSDINQIISIADGFVNNKHTIIELKKNGILK